MKTKESLIKKIYPYTSKLQRSYKFAAFVSLLLSIVALLEIIFFSISYLEGNPIYVDSLLFGDDQLWVTITSLTITTLVIPFGVMSSISMGNRNKNAFWCICTQFFFFGINAILLGLWFTLLRYIVIIMFLGYQYYNWDTKVEKDNEITYRTFKIQTLVGVLLISSAISIGLGFGIDRLFWNFDLFNTNFKPEYLLPFLDAASTVFGLVGFGLLSFNIKDGYYFIALLNIFNLTLYSIQAQWVVAVNSIVFLTLDSFGFIAWEYNYMKKNINYNEWKFSIFHTSSLEEEFIKDSFESLQQEIDHINREL